MDYLLTKTLEPDVFDQMASNVVNKVKNEEILKQDYGLSETLLHNIFEIKNTTEAVNLRTKALRKIIMTQGDLIMKICEALSIQL